MEIEKSYKHIFKYTGLFGGVQGLNILIGLVRNKIIAWLLGPTGLGLISIYNTASALLQNSTNFGLQMSGVREISRAFDNGDAELMNRHIRILRLWSLIAALLGFVVCIAASNFLSQWAFSSNDYTLEFILLSPVVAMAAISGGETAILKATRRLKQLAKISVGGVIGALAVSVPLYFKFGNDGIIPSLIIIAVVQMVLATTYSYRYYPPKIIFNTKELRAGKTMISIGIAFVIAGIFGSGAEFIIRAFLSDMSVSLAGLYNAGYMITMTYAGMVFAAMETDYYPHLSAVCNNTDKMNGAANRQIEVSLIIVAPMLVVLMLSLPILIPLLFSGKFLPIIGMTQIAVIAMYFRAVNLPVAYIMLAKGDSKSYMLLELVYDILIVLAIIIGYNNWGLDGTGIALAVAGLADCICVVGYCSWKYDFVLSNRLFDDFFVQLLIGLITLLAVKFLTGWLYWFAGLMLVSASIYESLKMFKRRLHD
jgi:O-antigen/teichoic acid export membrane protein